MIARYSLLAALVIGFLFLASNCVAQSQALNGQIEGTVFDQAGAVVRGASIIVTNIESGTIRKTTTDQSGVYRFPLLPLGTYRVVMEASGFRRWIHTGVTVVAGQAVTVNPHLEPGEILETVTVSGDPPIADTGKTQVGRVMNSCEVHNVPLPTRNPYSFVILQANVTGRANRGFYYPQINVNGFARRVSYLLDGNTNTQDDRSGVRLMRISETYLSEVQILTSGFTAEFGNTTGMIANVLTPSGTNKLSGSVLYLFNRPSFYARPFFFSASDLPDNRIDDVAVTIGGPIIKDRWHYYFGFEKISRDDNTRPNSQVTISEADKLELIREGVSPSIFVPAMPSEEAGSHFIFRTDIQINGNNRLAVRFNHAAVAGGGVTGGFNTLERSVDPNGVDHSLGLQLVSLKDRTLNEFRFQFTRSKNVRVRNEHSGTGPSVTIPNHANFGSPSDADAVGPLLRVTQMQDNLTWTRGYHSIKLGGGFSLFNNFTRSAVSSIYTFPSIRAYADARRGLDRHAYTKYEETFGDPETRYSSSYWNLFAQDEWKPTPRLKFNYGIRYDLYAIPEADPTSAFPASRKFNTDRNNFAPRFGVVYALRQGSRPLVLRAGAGIYYEAPPGDMYTKALRNNGDPKFFSLIFKGTDGGTRKHDPLARAFPETFSSTQPDSPLLKQSIVTISPDFENMYAIHSNIQLEQSLTEDLSLTLGYAHSGGRHIPVYRSINAINPVRYLSDGRPVFGDDRLDPRFDRIQMAESVGVSQYDALTLQLSQRFVRGIQFSAHYTLSRAVDDAPEQDVDYEDGNRSLRVLSDPTNRSLDKGYSYGDQRHTFVMSLVARPQVGIQNRTVRYLLNNNQFGIIARANSGERFSVRSVKISGGEVDLNGDGFSWPDRPVGIKRNSGKTPPQFNLDLRYSRFANFSERYRLEVFGEIQNLFNTNSIVAFNDITVRVNSITGEMIGPMPDFEARNASRSLESRQLQIGIRFHF